MFQMTSLEQTVLFSCAILAGAVHSQEATSLENAYLRVAWEAEKGVFELQRPDRAVFARLRFDGAIGEVTTSPWQHENLGAGQAMEASLPDGELGRIIVLPDLPFVLVQKRLTNPGTEVRQVHHVRPFEFGLELRVEPGTLKALGTAGLTAVDDHEGSYVFLAVVEPENRNGVVSGWLSHDRGSGVVFSDIDDGKARIQPQIDYGNLKIHPGATEDSEFFAFGLFDDARLGLEAYADAIVEFYQIRLRPILDGFCTWYSKKYGGACDEVHLAELSKLAVEKLKPYGFDFIQIDDKWQEGERRNGPANNFYTHKPEGPYPSGMKKAADNIRSLGLIPGIWFMPFAGDHEDPFFMEHLDWFVKQKDGTPYSARWGGTSLDMTNPDAREYTRSIVSRIAHEWGYDYLKMDGLWTGSATQILYVNNAYKEDDIGEAVFHDPHKTNVEAYRDGLKLVREAAGPDVFFLGCNVSQNMRTFGGSFGLVDAMRIGPDNGAARTWKKLTRGPWHGTNRYFLHGRVWHNDPDPLGIDPDMPLNHVQFICSWVALSGQLNVFSEWLPDIPDERIDVLRRTLPNHGLLPRPADLFEHELSRVWLLTDTRRDVRRDVIGLFNWEETDPKEFDYDLSWIGLDGETRYVGYDFWADEFVALFSGRLKGALPQATCRILAVRPESDSPQLLSTSRHITQGMVDVIEETWDAKAMTLAGRSEVVGDDPYELRIVAPVGEDAYRVSGVEVSDGAKVTWEQDGPMVRVRVENGKSGLVDWKVRFGSGSQRVHRDHRGTEDTEQRHWM